MYIDVVHGDGRTRGKPHLESIHVRVKPGNIEAKANSF